MVYTDCRPRELRPESSHAQNGHLRIALMIGYIPSMDIDVDKAGRVRNALMEASGLGLGQLQLLLSVAVRPGASISELADMVGVPQQTASRYVAALSGRYQYDENDMPELLTQGLGADDTRKRAVNLTTDGQAFVQRFISTIFH